MSKPDVQEDPLGYVAGYFASKFYFNNQKSTELCEVIVDIHLITIIYPLLLQTYHYALVGTLQVDKWIFELCLSLV